MLVQRTVVADDQGAFGRIDSLEPFDLELPDGSIVRVHPTNEARIEPLREETTKWGDIEDDPSYATLRERGPGPHVTVVVKRSAITAGDRVALEGEEEEFAFEDESNTTLRTAPAKKLSAVTADVLATGDDPERVLAHVVDGRAEEPKKRAKRKTKKEPERAQRKLVSYVTVPRVLSFLGMLILLGASTMRTSPGFVDAVTLAIVLYGIALTVASTRSLPRFVRGKLSVEELPRGAFASGVLGGLVFASLLCLALLSDMRWAWSLPPAGYRETNASWLVGPGAILFLAFLAGSFVVSTRKRASLLQALLGAPPFTAKPDETKWGSVEGVVRDPTPISVGGAPRALANVIEREVRAGSDPDIVTEEVLNQGTFFVDGDAGSFEIDPRAATWASAVRVVTTDTEKRHVFADVVAIGGRALVAGRAVTPAKGEPARFVAGRAESLVFYATGRDDNARSKVRILLLRRQLAIVALVALIGIVVGMLVHYEPQLPGLHVEGGGGD